MQELQTNTDDVRKSAHTLTSMTKSRQENKIDILEIIKNMSNWNRMVHLISTLEQYKRFLSHKHLRKLAVKSDVEAQVYAEKTIIRLLQLPHYEKDLEHSEATKQLCKLHPFVDSDGLLKVGGQLEYGHYLEYGEKHPIILPKDPIAMQLVRHYHVLTGHQGRRPTLAQLHLRRYWVAGHSIISSVINSCTICKRLRANLQGQQMAPIPEKRTEPSPPFTYVGCDVFGPFLVKDRRSVIKKYGAIFTCMASKAIHIEMIDDMTTDACLNDLKCFIAIRGPVRQLHTDRGTNFIGAANELHGQIQSGKLSTFTTDNHIEFVTNVPYASHI
ncbi:uncharacterized protein [Watersipora subatra]|uniref:uncharacterized protein n=1 Tax=Watersipora subatra TaxID=2589382 RepID=UPI00355B5C88